MAGRKSMVNMIWESNLTPVSSIAHSPSLRRRSMVAPKTAVIDFSLNNDEVERLERRRQIDSLSTPPSASLDRRKSMGYGSLSEMPSPKIAEGINECIRLGAENKINIKNAFSLKIIDYMVLMLKKTNATGYDLQVGSTSLDVSTKIYGYRVDGIHQEVLKLAAGHEKRIDLHDEDVESNANDPDNNNDVNPKENRPKKKSKARRNILSTHEALEGKIETWHPTIMSAEGDLQSSDMLYQAILPHHSSSKFYLHHYDDVILDQMDPDDIWIEMNTEIPLPIIRIPENSTICPTFESFEFLGWSIDDESENTPPAETHNTSILQFDLDASLPVNNESFGNQMDHFDLNDDDENVDRCIPEANLRRENIVDFRQVLCQPGITRSLEYSYTPVSMNHHWAGPSHWKMKTLFRNNDSVSTKFAAKPNSETVKKRKEVVLNFDEQSTDELFAPSNSVKLASKTIKTNWRAQNITLPTDTHYDVLELNKFYNQGFVISFEKAKEPLDVANLPEDAVNYDYNNDNDISNYCANTSNVDFHGSDDHHTTQDDYGPRLDDFESQVPYLGSNLVAIPKLSNKMSIAYSLRAKKIDMRQLKKCIWNCLTSNNKENVDSQATRIEQTQDKSNEVKNLSNIYKTLPTVLSRNNVEALSIPIAFLSLLHLANEKQLAINMSPDESDVVIIQD